MKTLSVGISLVSIALVGLTAVACGSSVSTDPTSTNLCANSGAAATVDATDTFAFAPATITITVGQSVCWQNAGTMSHTVTDNATAGTRFNGTLPRKQAFVHTFGFGGSFIYHCNNHSNMTGTIVVNCRPGELVC